MMIQWSFACSWLCRKLKQKAKRAKEIEEKNVCKLLKQGPDTLWLLQFICCKRFVISWFPAWRQKVSRGIEEKVSFLECRDYNLNKTRQLNLERVSCIRSFLFNINPTHMLRSEEKMKWNYLHLLHVLFFASLYISQNCKNGKSKSSLAVKLNEFNHIWIQV